jgi:hypothetical protein
VLAKQVLYYLSHAMPPLYALLIFEVVSHFLPGPAWTSVCASFVVGMTGACHCAQLY